MQTLKKTVLVTVAALSLVGLQAMAQHDPSATPDPTGTPLLPQATPAPPSASMPYPPDARYKTKDEVKKTDTVIERKIKAKRNKAKKDARYKGTPGATVSESATPTLDSNKPIPPDVL